MRFLRLSLAPDVVPVSASITHGEILTNRYLSDGSVVELSRFEGSEDALVSALEGNPSTVDFEVVGGGSGYCYLYHHLHPDEDTAVHLLLSLLDEFRLVIVFPVRIDPESGVTVDLVGTTEMIQRAYRRLPPEVKRFTRIKHLGERVSVSGGPRSRLTERQREILDAAVEVGYYSVPREGTAEDVAAVVGCAPSTASEHLRKIEARVLSALAA